jgi:hypothetical protein
MIEWRPKRIVTNKVKYKHAIQMRLYVYNEGALKNAFKLHRAASYEKSPGERPPGRKIGE